MEGDREMPVSVPRAGSKGSDALQLLKDLPPEAVVKVFDVVGDVVDVVVADVVGVVVTVDVGVVVGVVFGTTAGLKIADFLGVLGRVTLIEITVMGATLASVSAWWGLGALQRLVERYQLSAPRKRVSKGPTD